MKLLEIDAKAYLAEENLTGVKPHWQIEVAERAFPPRLDDLKADWVATVATPAFRQIRKERGRIESFASIGTGTGIDVLAAIAILAPDLVGATDLFSDVTETAKRNIEANLHAGTKPALYVEAGDLLSPLADLGLRFDVIYENLPNIPATEIETGHRSSSFLPPRAEERPAYTDLWMVGLHYLALKQAAPLLNENGFTLSTIGARIPLTILLQMAQDAGLSPDFLSLGWKVQTEAEDVLGSYSKAEKEKKMHFSFYPVPVLEEAFQGRSFAETGHHALALEAALEAKRITATEAFARHQKGERIGHLVAVLRGRKTASSKG